MRDATAGLQQLFVPEAILTSPIVRAQQTADILGKAYNVTVEHCAALGRGEHAETIAAIRRQHVERCMVVGHEPWMSELLAYLTTGSADGLGAVFKKGAAALVTFPGRFEPGEGVLEWLVQPGALRMIAKH